MTISTDQAYREAHRRRHRLLGFYLALEGWQQGLECVVLRRNELLPFLGLKHMQDKRLDWLKADVRDYFPHSFVTENALTRRYNTLYLSRRRIPVDSSGITMSDVDRAKLFTSGGLASDLVKIPTEQRLVEVLARKLHGL